MGARATVCTDGECDEWSCPCSGDGMYWTGKQCCADLGSSSGSADVVEVPSTPPALASSATSLVQTVCTDGSYTDRTWPSYACSGDGMQWTGSQCCVTGSPVCTDGTCTKFNCPCSGDGVYWTGSKCCVELDSYSGSDDDVEVPSRMNGNISFFSASTAVVQV